MEITIERNKIPNTIVFPSSYSNPGIVDEALQCEYDAVKNISRNSSQGSNAPLSPQYLIDKYRNLKSVFYTVDYAELDDGLWKIIEVGDGSVSGLSDNQDYIQFFEELHNIFC